MGRRKGSKNKPKFSLEAEKVEKIEEVTETVKATETMIQVPTIIPESAKVIENKDNLPEGYEFLKKADYDKLKLCKKCGAHILGDPYRIDTNYIAGLCSAHREHPRYICVCRNCAKKLSDIVDNWLGEEYPDKWELHKQGLSE